VLAGGVERAAEGDLQVRHGGTPGGMGAPTLKPLVIFQKLINIAC